MELPVSRWNSLGGSVFRTEAMLLSAQTPCVCRYVLNGEMDQVQHMVVYDLPNDLTLLTLYEKEISEWIELVRKKEKMYFGPPIAERSDGKIYPGDQFREWLLHDVCETLRSGTRERRGMPHPSINPHWTTGSSWTKIVYIVGQPLTKQELAWCCTFVAVNVTSSDTSRCFVDGGTKCITFWNLWPIAVLEDSLGSKFVVQFLGLLALDYTKIWKSRLG